MRKKKGVILTEVLDAHFTEKYGAPWIAKGEAIGEVRGEARGKAKGKVSGKAETILTVLRARFKKVPKEVEMTMLAMTDSIALDSWAVLAATCTSMNEFAAAIK